MKLTDSLSFHCRICPSDPPRTRGTSWSY